MRPLWRWWEEKNGADIWWARVEVRPGEWTDIEQARYDAEVREPPFWSLPLKDDYHEQAHHDSLEHVALNEWDKKFKEAIMIVLMLGGSLAFIAVVMFYVIKALIT